MIRSVLLYTFVLSFMLSGCDKRETRIPDPYKLAKVYYGEDSAWYLQNVPFFECSDPELEQVFYYRWKLYKAHIRNVGQNQFVVTEFINDVHWDIDPYSTINAASGHHIYEGRWLKDDRYMDGYIDYLYHHGGNNRSYSEWIADAAYARFLVNADTAFITSQLDSMKTIYEAWSDHWEASKNLYFIPAMPDATEYTIASIDASGGKDGFAGGDAFRPTFNSYMYGNATAISNIAALKRDESTFRHYKARAQSLKSNVENSLWNDSLQHFLDRFKQNNQYVHYWNFIRGRELAGMIPWSFNLPSGHQKFSQAWRHVTDTTFLLGKYGFRTNEPSYEYYFKQYVYSFGRRGSQWNGPSWPFQSSHVLTGMANLLHNYDQSVVTTEDYVNLLRLFARQHYLPTGDINLVENYDPNHGGPIVHFYWSNHYNHSSFNNLVISGLCGILPSLSDSLVIHPLVDSSIKYFALVGLKYHGHDLTVTYDKDDQRYHAGKGVHVWVDHRQVEIKTDSKGRSVVYVGKLLHSEKPSVALNAALNIRRSGFPTPSASVNNVSDSLHQAIDGRIWYFPEISNRWTTEGSKTKEDWFSLDFGQSREVSQLKIYPFVDQNRFLLPEDLRLEYKSRDQWVPIRFDTVLSLKANTQNSISFEKVSATALRILMRHPQKDVAIGEIEVF